MARVKGPLRLFLTAGAAATAVLLIPAVPSAAPQSQWYKPIPSEGKVFPVLISPQMSWLNWRDTYGAPRMRLQPDGTWKQVGKHEGIDIYAERGTPVVSVSSGIVENVGWTFYSGFRVGVRGTDGRYYFYAHLLPGSSPAGISKGAVVDPGTRLGLLGSSGYGPEGTSDEFPPHLHFGLQETSRRWVNAEPMLRRLYAAQMAAVKAARSQASVLEGSAAALRARAYAPSSPPVGVLIAEAARLDETARALQRSMLL